MSTFAEKELAILRNAVDKIQDDQKREEIKSGDIVPIIQIVEDFIKQKKLICYGGSAINNILPDDDQFYDKNIDVPDYDFFSKNAMKDAKKLADIFHKEGYNEIEAKAGVHFGTYKVFVNFIPIADITQLSTEIFDILFNESIIVNEIRYASPNFLRMSMYLELSRPRGDVTRWEKVLNRLVLLNKHYPIQSYTCKNIEVRRKFTNKQYKSQTKMLFNTLKNAFIREGVVFFGGFAFGLYSKYMPRYFKKARNNQLDFDVISTNANKTAQYIKDTLKGIGITNTEIVHHESIGEIIPNHYEIKIQKDTIAFVYQSDACYGYNEYFDKVCKRKIRVASIDTILYFYLAFQFTSRQYYDKERLVCLAQFLFVLQEKNRLKQIGLLKRFSDSCYGTQETIQTIRTRKSEKFKTLQKTLKKNKKSKEFEKWFLKYVPS